MVQVVPLVPVGLLSVRSIHATRLLPCGHQGGHDGPSGAAAFASRQRSAGGLDIAVRSVHLGCIPTRAVTRGVSDE
jgi:hypothetical protein